MPKPVDHDELAELTERAVKLKKLAGSPEWAELRSTLEQRRDRTAAQLAKRVMSPAGIGQDEIVRSGCFWAGVFAVLDTPEAVETKLETMLKRAQREQGDET